MAQDGGETDVLLPVERVRHGGNLVWPASRLRIHILECKLRDDSRQPELGGFNTAAVISEI